MGLPIGPLLIDLTDNDGEGNFYAGIVRPVPVSLVEGLEPAKVVFAASGSNEEQSDSGGASEDVAPTG